MKHVRILVVDDDRSQCALIKRSLADLGYTVDVAYDGESALQLVAQHDYALGVLDYQMPGMDGVELYRRIREISPATIGIFLTAFTTLNTVYPAISAGVERVLAKPVQLGELLPLVEELAGKPESAGA